MFKNLDTNNNFENSFVIDKNENKQEINFLSQKFNLILSPSIINIKYNKFYLILKINFNLINLP